MRRRIVFIDPVSVAQFADFAAAQGWPYAGDGSDVDPDTEEHVWLAGDEIDVHWIDDPVLHRVYAVVIGPQPAVVEGRIRFRFDSYTVDEAVDQYRTAAGWPERVEALSLLAATAPEDFDPDVFATLSAGLTDQHEVVRHQAVLGVFYAPWSELRPTLEQLAASDPYAEARRVAEVALESLPDPPA